MISNQQPLEQSIDHFEPDVESKEYADGVKTNELAKVAFGALIGATLGALAGALAMRSTAYNVNKTVKNVGSLFKKTVSGFNENVKTIGDTIKDVSDNVNETTQDLGNVVRDAAIDVNDTVKRTVDTVTTTVVNVNDTVQNTVDIVKGTGEGVTNIVKSKMDIAKSATADEPTQSSNLTQSSNQSINVVNLADNQAVLIVPMDQNQDQEEWT